MSSELISEISVAGPLIALTVGALLVLLRDVFSKRSWYREGLVTLTLLVAAGAMISAGEEFIVGRRVFSGIIFADPFTYFLTGLILVTSLLAVLLGGRQLKSEGIESPGEYYTLLLVATFGAIALVSSAELVTLFLALETMSMALYCLCGSAVGVRRGAESALKYFLLGSFSSAFLLYGIALVYGLTGTTFIPEIAQRLGSGDQVMLLFALGLMFVGLLFKVGAVPFHFWVPDVYQGAPAPVTAYMACVVKIAAVGATLRVLWAGFGGAVAWWAGAIWIIAVLTMVIGNLIALRQRSLKRLLAYSSIAHAGYMMMALLARDTDFGGGAAILFYLIAYSVMTLGAFSVVVAVAGQDAQDINADDLTRFQGLGTRRPVIAALMAVFMLSLAGIPPGMAGLLGKVYLLSAVVKAEYVGLAVIAVLASAVSCYYYLRVVSTMYFQEAPEGMSATSGMREVGLSLGTVMVICALLAVVLGVFPAVVHDAVAIVVRGV